jgi:hypothetical protein
VFVSGSVDYVNDSGVVFYPSTVLGAEIIFNTWDNATGRFSWVDSVGKEWEKPGGFWGSHGMRWEHLYKIRFQYDGNEKWKPLVEAIPNVRLDTNSGGSVVVKTTVMVKSLKKLNDDCVD